MNGEVYVNTSGTYAFGVGVPLFYRLPFWRDFVLFIPGSSHYLKIPSDCLPVFSY
jgi:hypothetical protein